MNTCVVLFLENYEIMNVSRGIVTSKNMFSSVYFSLFINTVKRSESNGIIKIRDDYLLMKIELVFLEVTQIHFSLYT